MNISKRNENNIGREITWSWYSVKRAMPKLVHCTVLLPVLFLYIWHTTLPMEMVYPEPARRLTKLQNASLDVTRNTSTGGYLLSMYDSDRGLGPNAQYAIFKEHLALAIKLNRTFVDRGFTSHWTESVIQRPRYINETFDIEKLNEIAKFSSVAKFKLDCDGKIERVLMPQSCAKNGTIDSERYSSAQRQYSEIYGITIPDATSVTKIVANKRPEEDVPTTVRCLAVFSRVPYSLPALNTVSQKMKSPVDVATAAIDVSKKLCDGKPYMALHWRDKIGEG
ncbi:uncharacterized protein LOC144347848 [Saccoglossus kowalevskii]